MSNKASHPVLNFMLICTFHLDLILVQPEGGSPRLHVSKSVMSIGEQALVECWSDRSKPAADLQFFINGNRVREISDYELSSDILHFRFLGRRLMIWKYFLRAMVS